MSTKQVIVIRRDLGMRRGKEIAQGAHASLSFLTRRMVAGRLERELTPQQIEWLQSSFTKVCVKVNSEEELKEIHNKATEAGLESHLICDNGYTEFKGVPTLTCLAIGPDDGEKIDKITGHLTLL